MISLMNYKNFISIIIEELQSAQKHLNLNHGSSWIWKDKIIW